MERKCLLALVCLLVCRQMSAMDKEELLSKYHRRFFVVLQDGLPACFSGLEQAASKLTRGVVAILGEKTLYKYKDMTVEFHDGKVTDVR
jgi:hypothetical protein